MSTFVLTMDNIVRLLLGRSRLRTAILALLVDSPDVRLHLREIARRVGTSAGTARRELARLEAAGLVVREAEGRQVYFRAAAEGPLFDAVREIVRRTVGAPSVVRQHLAGLVGVDRALIFGSYAAGTDTGSSDIDLLVVGEPPADDLTDRLEAAEDELGRPLNAVVMTERELDERRARGDGFIRSIDGGPVITAVP